MKKILVTMMALALTIGAQAQQDDGLDAMMAAMIAAKIHQDSIDTSSLVAVYDYECQTQDADAKAVTDRMKVCLQVGQHCTRSSMNRNILVWDAAVGWRILKNKARLGLEFDDILNNEDGRRSQQTTYQQTTSWHDFRHHYVGIRFTYHLDAKEKLVK
jgi:hypothetical protein